MTMKQWICRLAVTLAIVAFAAVLPGASSAQMSGPNRAGLVIAHGNGETIKRCVEFAESQITGLELLQRAGLNLNVDASNAIGVSVCSIDSEGCTYPDQACFCQCQGSPCVYWSYWHLTADNAWQYSNMGTANNALHNGDVDGWIWGAGTTSSANPPPQVTFDEICTFAHRHTYRDRNQRAANRHTHANPGAAY